MPISSKLAEIKARRAAITGAPWGIYADINLIDKNGNGPLSECSNRDGWIEKRKGNVRFAAHAPTDIAALVKAVEEARELLREFHVRLQEAFGNSLSTTAQVEKWLEKWGG